MNQTARSNWVLWALIIVVPAISGFVARRLHAMLRASSPAWTQSRTIVGPSVDTKPGFDLPLNQFRALVDDDRLLAKARGGPLDPVEMYELSESSREVVVWRVEEFVNQGFEPQTRFECPLNVPENTLLGYYALDGTRVPAVIRRLRSSQNHPPAVELRVTKAVAPGDTLLVIRRARRIKAILDLQRNIHVFPLGRVATLGSERAWRAVVLPRGAVVLRYGPDEGSLMGSERVPLVRWENLSTKSNAFVEFSISPRS